MAGKSDIVRGALGGIIDLAEELPQIIRGDSKKGTDIGKLQKHDNLVVPHLDDPNKKLIQDYMGMDMHQLATPDQEFTLVGGLPGNINATTGVGKVRYGVIDETGTKNIGRVTLRRKIGSETAEGIDGIINLEIDPEYRGQGYATKILDSLRASTDGRPLTLYDIENTKFFKNYVAQFKGALSEIVDE
jgi:GNAT superfamily N-acetyltransferase